MKIYIKYDINAICKKILQEQLDKLGLKYLITGLGEVEIQETISREKLQQLNDGLNMYGSEILENNKGALIQRIKDAIIEMVYLDEKQSNENISSYLENKIGLSYGHISNIFSDTTYTSISNFLILQKIERAKQLMIAQGLTTSEISWKLNYSSVAHFCTQFKNATGLTPSAFQRIINKRKTY
jgi:AraC-like DNA-binding protein